MKTRIYLGIDWGTQSSKWAAEIDHNGKSEYFNGIVRSDLLCHNDEIIMDPMEDYLPKIERVRSFKGCIIKDPFTPFWDAPRDDVGMSMGAGVVFSICTLFGDFLSTLRKKKIPLKDIEALIEIGFSFPNWLKTNDAGSLKAATNYHEAIVISSYLFRFFDEDLPHSLKPYSVHRWRDLIEDARKVINFSQRTDLSIADMTVTKYTPENFGFAAKGDNIIWRYLVESCAAGLPYLRTIKLQSPRGLPGLGKLLVVDVGAGSTDIGYMLRTVSPQGGGENLIYFPPAATLRVAGDKLTEEIRELHYSKGRNITFADAEVLKITRSHEWVNKPFADRWRREISEHVEEYIMHSPDMRWLNMDVPLQLIITGGSGVVDGLASKLKASVIEALMKRRLERRVAEKVKLINENLFEGIFPIKENYARMAVAIGSADKNKPLLKFRAKMDPVTRVTTRIVKY
jgi:hypothetical protein